MTYCWKSVASLIVWLGIALSHAHAEELEFRDFKRDVSGKTRAWTKDGLKFELVEMPRLSGTPVAKRLPGTGLFSVRVESGREILVERRDLIDPVPRGGIPCQKITSKPKSSGETGHALN